MNKNQDVEAPEQKYDTYRYEKSFENEAGRLHFT